MRLKKISAFLSVIMLFSGCGSDKSDKNLISYTSSQQTISSSSEKDFIVTDEIASDFVKSETYLKNFPSYDEVKALYPDKTVIVWSFESNIYDKNTNVRTRELNKYLDEKGYDFVLCFDPADTMLSDEKYAYINYIKNKTANDEPVDIIFNSARFIAAEGLSAYNASVYAGILEPLNDYLKSESGKNLYNLMPENFWKALKINDKIYGFNSSFSQLTKDFGYFINKNLADKYGFDVNKSILEQLDILKAIKEKEDVDVVSAFNTEYMSEPSFFGTPNMLSDCVYIDSGEIRSVFEDKSYLDNLKLFNVLKSNGLLSSDTFEGDNSLDNNHKSSAFIIIDSKHAGAVAYKKESGVEFNYYGEKIQMIPVFKTSTAIRSANAATGICAFSKNKEKAFEALTLILTDSYINNLMSYGIEGEDYVKNGNYAELSQSGNPFGKVRFSNKMICYSAENDYENAAGIYESAFNEAISDALGFVFDGRSVETQLIATALILESDVKGLLFVEDFDKEIEKIKQKLEKAGLNQIINECKKQYTKQKTEG